MKREEKQPGAISFFVPGAAKTAGSKIPGQTKSGKLYVRDDCAGSGNWKGVVATFALPHRPKPLLTGPLSMTCTFYMKRPKHHYVAGKYEKGLKALAQRYHIVVPDGLKLTRAIEDSLTGIIYHDDAQIADEHIQKLYADEPGHIGVEIEIRKLKE